MLFRSASYLPLTPEVMVAGGLARSEALVKHLSALLDRDIVVAQHPEYVGAIGAVVSYGGGE